MRPRKFARLSSFVISFCVLSFLPATALGQDDPFSAPSEPTAPHVRTYAGAQSATVRVRALSPLGAGEGGHFVAVASSGLGVVTDLGIVVTSTAVVGASTVCLVMLADETAWRVAYAVRTDEARGLVMLAIPSARTARGRSLDRFEPQVATAPLEVFEFDSPEARTATPRPMALGRVDGSGRTRVLGTPTPGALVIATDDTLRGLVHEEPDGERTLIPIADVRAFHDALRTNADGVRGASAEAEALMLAAARVYIERSAGLDDAAARALADVAPLARDVSRVSLEGLSAEARLVIAGALFELANRDTTDRFDIAALRRAARTLVTDAISLDSTLARRATAAGVILDSTEAFRAPSTPTGPPDDELDDIESGPRAAAPARDRPRFRFTGAHAPRFFVLSLAMPFAPSSNVHIGGLVLDASTLWMIPKGDREATRRIGLAVGPTVSVGANGGDPSARIGAELGLLARFGLKPGLFVSASWVPSMYFGEGERAITASAFRARLGVSIKRFGVALGYDVASPNGVYAYHAIELAFVRER